MSRWIGPFSKNALNPHPAREVMPNPGEQARYRRLWDGTEVRTTNIPEGPAKARITRPEQMKVGQLSIGHIRVNPFFAVEDKPAWAIIDTSIQPSPDFTREEYKRALFCFDYESGFFGYAPDPTDCNAIGDEQAMHGPNWWKVDGATIGTPGVGRAPAMGEEFPLASVWLAHNQVETLDRLTIDLGSGHPHEEDSQYVSYSTWVIEFDVVEGQYAQGYRALLDVKTTFTNPVTTYYTSHVTDHEEILPDNSNCVYNFNADPAVDAIDIKYGVTLAGRGDTILLPNHGVGFSHKYESYGDPPLIVQPKSHEILDPYTGVGNNGIFTVGEKAYKMTFTGFRYLSRVDWQKWLDVIGIDQSTFLHPTNWFSKSGYPTDYDPSFHDPSVTRPEFYAWHDISSSVVDLPFFRTANIINVMVRITPA